MNYRHLHVLTTQSMRSAFRSTILLSLPWAQNLVPGSRRHRRFADKNQFALRKPRHCGLGGALGYTNRFRQFLIADLNSGTPAMLLGRKP